MPIFLRHSKKSALDVVPKRLFDNQSRSLGLQSHSKTKLIEIAFRTCSTAQSHFGFKEDDMLTCDINVLVRHSWGVNDYNDCTPQCVVYKLHTYI